MTMPPEDKIYWGRQLETLPPLIRAAIIAVRLGGQTVTIMALVGVLIGMHLGLFHDQAARDREMLIEEARQQSAELRESRKSIEAQLHSLEEHVHTTKALALVMCANLHPGTYERSQCLEIMKK